MKSIELPVVKGVGAPQEDVLGHLSANSRESIRIEGGNPYELHSCSIDGIGNFEERYLKHTLYTQSNDSEIVQLAKEIVKREKSLLKKLRRISAFIIEYLSLNPDKSIKIGFARPKEILSLKTGDCTEYAILFASLSRALGIPNRIVGGVVYDGKYFAYHMWLQIWCNEWIDVDPAFQQIGVDATHIALVSSDLSESSITEMGIILTHYLSKTNYHILEVEI